jgi:hypothetical protein
MRVLLTNNTLAARAGTELYVRDVAIELMRRGHQPVVYSTHLGEVAEEIRSETVPVISSLEALGEAPDIIHAHHNYEAVAAIMQFPQVPAVSFCHGWTPLEENPLCFPQVRRYVAVSEVCRERLIAEGGISAGRIEFLPNFFNAKLFLERSPLPQVAARALSFNNRIGKLTGLPLLQNVCRRYGIRLDALGMAAGCADRRPGLALAKYDIVFACGRSAIEAMAVGAAVILCDADRLGPMVTSENFWRLHSMNFALRSLSEPFTEECLMKSIQKYDASDAAAVSAIVRRECEMKGAIDRILGIYETAIAEALKEGPPPVSECNRALVRHLEQSAPHYKSSLRAEERSEWMRRERMLQDELTSIRASKSWRWTQRPFQNGFVRRLFSSLMQRVENDTSA